MDLSDFSLSDAQAQLLSADCLEIPDNATPATRGAIVGLGQSAESLENIADCRMAHESEQRNLFCGNFSKKDLAFSMHQ